MEGTASFERSWWIDRFILRRRQIENTLTQIFHRQNSTYLYLKNKHKREKPPNLLLERKTTYVSLPFDEKFAQGGIVDGWSS